MMKLLLLVALLLPVTAYAATRDFPHTWSQECMTTEGDNLDVDGDGICEGLTGFRFYTETGQFIEGIVEDGTRSHTIRYNAPWGTQCHVMTAVMDDPINVGQVLESVMSNTGACRDVVPGNPKAPAVTN